jgi:hypothetical protein
MFDIASVFQTIHLKWILAYTVNSTKDLLKLNKERIITYNSITTNPQNVIRAKSKVKALLIA